MLVIPAPIFLVGLPLVGLLSGGRYSLSVLVVLASFFGVVGHVGPTVVLAMLAELHGVSFLGDLLA